VFKQSRVGTIEQRTGPQIYSKFFLRFGEKLCIFLKNAEKADQSIDPGFVVSDT